MNLDLKNSKKQIISAFVCTALFAVIGIILYFVFKQQAEPGETEYFDLYPEEWAWKYMQLFLVSVVFNLVFNIFVTVMAVFAKGFHRSQGSWWLAFSFNVLFGIALIGILNVRYPEETWCSIAASVLIMVQQILTFIISTYNCSNMWRRGYLPITK